MNNVMYSNCNCSCIIVKYRLRSHLFYIFLQADFDMLYNRLEEWRQAQEKTIHDKKDQSLINQDRCLRGQVS